MDNFDHLLKTQIQNDKLNTKPSETVFDNLRCQMLKNSALSQTKQNSFLPLFGSLAGKKYLAWKISAAAILLISFMGIKQMNPGHLYIQSADSLQVNQNPDTLNFQLADSSFTY